MLEDAGVYQMSSGVTFFPSIALGDEFADFELRDELERELDRRLKEADVDARPALKDFNPTADEDQLSLVSATGHQTIRLVAPAGSGKTQTLIHRVLHQAKLGMRPDRVLCLTFDNAAGKALRDKIAEQLAILKIGQHTFQISTLNAFGFRLLKDQFPSEFKPLVESSRVWRLIKEAREDLQRADGGRERNEAIPDTLKFRFFADYFSYLKNNLFDPRLLPAQTFADFMLQDRASEVFFTAGSSNEAKKLVIQAVHWVYKRYEVILQRESRIDFDDQKLRALQCLTAAPSTLDIIQRRYDEVIVDEFQDINRLDFALVCVISKQARLIVTGDDDQAIYGFRGCTPSYIIDLEKHSGREVKSFELRRNYRCPKNVVDHATRLIRNNTWRIEKSPIAVRSDDASIKVVESTTATAEAKMISTAVERIKRKNDSLQYHDFAVLYRTNAQSLPIQLQFILRDIPYNVREQDNILQNEELEKLLAVLHAKLALEQGAAVKSHDAVLTLKAYFRYFDQRSTARLEDLFGKSDSFFSSIKSEKFLSIIPKARNSRFPEVMLDVVSAPSLFKTLDILAKNFKGLRGMVGSLEDVIDGDVPLGEVYELAASFRGRVDAFVATVDTALERAKAARAGHDENGVVLATFFKAKGLQWHTVIITSCNQGIIPHKRAQIEEERKLFYVALTRASSNLILSYLKTSCKTKVSPSCFLREAGLHG